MQKSSNSPQRFSTKERAHTPIISVFPEFVDSLESYENYDVAKGTFGQRPKSLCSSRGAENICDLREPHKNIGANLSKSFLERSAIYENMRQCRINDTKEKFARKDIEKCSFKPIIHETEQTKNRKEKIVDRLFKLGAEQKMRIQAAQAKKEEEIEKHEKEICTFKPQIHSNFGKSKVLENINNGTSFLNKSSTNPEINKSHTQDIEKPQFTFKPQISEIKPEMSKIQEYIKTNPVTRLSKNFHEPRTIAKKLKKVEETQEKSLENHAQNPKVNFPKFYHRMQEHERKKQENHMKLLEKESEKYKQQPINKKSEEILSKTQTSFIERNKELASRKMSLKCQNNEDISQYSFRPEITEYAKKEKTKTVTELIEEPLKKKQEKIIKIKEKIEQNEAKVNTFAPIINKSKKFAGVSSKLHIKDNTAKYIEYVNAKKESIRVKKEYLDKERAIKEQLECTYAPKINKKKVLKAEPGIEQLL